MKGYLSYIIICLSLLHSSSCKTPLDQLNYNYDLTQPDKTLLLPAILLEISGLAYDHDNMIYCINDEDGIVFRYDLIENKIDRKIKFGKRGDYEGIAKVGDDLYVIKSNSTIFRISNFGLNDSILVDKIKPTIDKSCNVEGLCFDIENNTLLISCKGNIRKNNNYKFKKVVFAYNIEDRYMEKQAKYIIDIKEIIKNLGDNDNQISILKNKKFKPSAIAIHPITGEVFVLSSIAKALIVLAKNGDFKYAMRLNRSIFKQPEGLTFDPNGTMYISNEGQGAKANIKIFKYNSK